LDAAEAFDLFADAFNDAERDGKFVHKRISGPVLRRRWPGPKLHRAHFHVALEVRIELHHRGYCKRQQ
jgi:hypothetical protein